MIYFDAAFIAKCYVNEAGAAVIRGVARQAGAVASCEIARLEMASVFRRQRREHLLTTEGLQIAQGGLAQDEQDGVWQWLPLNAAVVEAALRALESMPEEVLLRAGDALHLACARLHGFSEIYSNDRQLLAAAPYFQLAGINPLE